MAQYKFTEDGTAIVKNEDGLPIVIDDDGKESGINAIANLENLRKANAESKDRKDSIKALKEKFKPIVDLDIPDDEFSEWVTKSVEALEQVSNFNIEDYKKVEEVENIKRTAAEDQKKKLEQQTLMYEKEKTDLLAKNELQGKQIEKLMISDKFTSSKFVQDKLNIPTELAKSHFLKNFRIKTDEDSEKISVEAIDNDGTVVLDTVTFEPADFETAIEILVGKDINKDSLLKGSGAGGSGAPASGTNPSGVVNPFVKDSDHYSVTKQAELMNTNSVLAHRLANEAGVTLPVLG